MRDTLTKGTDGRRWVAWAALLVTVLCVSWSAPFVRWAGVTGSASAFYRMLFASSVLVPALLIQRLRVRRRAGTDAITGTPLLRLEPGTAGLAFVGGAFLAVDLAMFNTAVLKTKAATAVLLGNNAPVFVGLASWLLFGRRQRLTFWMGMTCAIAGCAAIVLQDAAGKDSLGHGDLAGDLLALGASVFFAAYLVMTERVRAGMDTLTFSTFAIAGSVLTLLAICLGTGVPLGGYPLRSWVVLAGLGLVSQLSAYFALVYALGHLPATVTSVGLLAQVPLSAALAAALLGEPLTAAQVVGGALVLAGIYVVSRG